MKNLAKTAMALCVCISGITANASIAAAAGEKERVFLYNWSDYIAPEAIEMFEAETGLNLVYDSFESNEFMEAKLLAGRTGYDVTVPSSIAVSNLANAGVLAPFDRSKLTNWGNLSPEILKLMEPYDPGNQLMVPYTFWTFGIVVNTDLVEARLGKDYPRTWALLFDPQYASQLRDCGIQLVDSGTEFIAMALNYLGLDPNSEKRRDLNKAIDVLVEMTPSVTKVATDGLESNIANGDICMGVIWSGDALAAIEAAVEAEDGVNLEFFVPTDGSSFDFEGFSLLADAPNPEGAHLFVDFMLRPDIAAINANYVRYGTPNTAAQEFVEEELTNNPAVYPPPEAFETLFTYSVKSLRTERIISRGWTRVLTGR